MLEDRNTAAMTFLNAQGQAAEPKENLFEESEEVEDKQPASKKRKCADAGDFTVEIQVQEQPVQVLLRGARPTRSDFAGSNGTRSAKSCFCNCLKKKLQTA